MADFYPIGNTWQRAFAVWRRQGTSVLLRKILSALGYRRLLLLGCPVAEAIAEAPAAAVTAAVTIGILPAEGIADYLALRPGTSAAVVARRLRAGHLCFIARGEGQLVAACWSATQDAWSDYLGCAIPFAAGDVYLYDAFTHPNWRGQEIAPAVCRAQLAHFREAGYRRAIRATVPENIPALRAHSKSGFRPIGMLTSVRSGPWRRASARVWRA
jgi:ribosomal protein S18 acetylase RimI-like enzyme